MTLEELNKTCKDFSIIIMNDDEEKPQVIHFPSINFYGCSFNFEKDGCAESRFYNGDDVYNPRKEV